MADGTLKVGTITTSSGSGTITIGQSGETVAIASGVTQTIANNTPAFLAYLSGNTTVNDNTLTKIANNTERYDTDNAYDNSSNYRFTVPSGKAGKYYLYGTSFFSGTDELYRTTLSLYVNGSAVHSVHGTNPYSGTNYGDGIYFGIAYDLSVGDYAEMYVYVDTDDGSTAALKVSDTGVTNGVYFGGFKLT